MPRSYEELESAVSSVLGAVRTVQVDIMDGRFVPGITWPYAWGGDSFDLREEEGLPFLRKLDYSMDLMVEDPLPTIPSWIRAGAARIILHAGSVPATPHTIENAKAGDIEIGFALHIDTEFEEVREIIPMLDSVQFMGIAEVGKQGEPFDERVVGKIKEFKARYPDTMVSVDGGVNRDTLPLLREIGVDRVAVGSAILKAEDPKEAIEDLSAL